MATSKTKTSRKRTVRKPPEQAKTFKFTPRYNEDWPTADHGAWVELSPKPDFGTYSEEQSHVYLYPPSPQSGDRNKYPLEWSSYIICGQRESGIELSNDGRIDWDGLKVDYDKHTITLPKALKLSPPPPPSPFEDTDERRAVIRAHVNGIRKAAEAMLVFEGQEEAAIAIGYVYDGNSESVRIDLNTDIEKAVAEAQAKMDKARPLHEAVKGLNDHDKKVVLRHLAHMFDIRKGLTNLR